MQERLLVRTFAALLVSHRFITRRFLSFDNACISRHNSMKDIEELKKRLRDIFAETTETDSVPELRDMTDKRIDDTNVNPTADLDDTPTYEHGALAFLKQVGKRNQFKVNILHKSDDDALCSFKYQGGYFAAHVSTREAVVSIQFTRYAELPYTKDNYIRALQACHRFNMYYRYAKFTFAYDESSNSLVFNISIETIEPSERIFISYLELVLRMANDSRDYINGPKQGRLPAVGAMPDDDEDFISLRRDLYRLAKAEMEQEDKNIRKRNRKAERPQNDSLGEYLTYLFDGEQTEDLLGLTIQSSEGLRELTDPIEIAEFKVMGSVVQGTGRKASFVSMSPVVITVDATAAHYIFTLHPLLNEKDFLSARLTAVRTPHEFLQNHTPAAVYTPQAFSIKLCHLKKTRKANVRDKEETQKEPFIPGLTAQYEEQFRNAHELVQSEFYLQAIVLLQPIYEAVKMKYWELRGHDRDLFFAVCYDLGFCYTELRLFEKAYFYLDLTRDSNRYDCEQMYFNSLAEGRDVRIFEDLQSEIEEVRRSIHNMRAEDSDTDDEDETDEEIFGEMGQAGLNRMIEYYAFLQRRLGYSQINFGYLDAAEETFRQLLKHDGSRDYAKQELKHIARLRTNEQHRKLH